MVTYRGYKTAIQYGSETSYGAGGTPATAIEGKVQTLTVNKVNNLIRTTGLGEGRNETFVGWGNFEVTWSMEYIPASFEFLQYAFSPVAGSGTTAAPYYLEESDYTGYTSTMMKSFAMEVASLGSTNEVETISGCVINTIGLSLNVGETLKLSLEGFGRSVLNGTSPTSFTPNSTKPWIFSQGNFKWNGNTVGRVTSATININNNLDPEVGRQIGSRFVEAAEFGLRKYDWVLTVKMTDTVATTLRDHFFGQINSPHLGIASAEPSLYAIIFDLSEGATSGLRNAQVKLSNCSINDISKPINIGDNIVELTINGAAKSATTDTVNKPFKWWTVT
jgi:hypothetical protein